MNLYITFHRKPCVHGMHGHGQATKLQFDVVGPQGGCQLTHGRPRFLQDAQVGTRRRKLVWSLGAPKNCYRIIDSTTCTSDKKHRTWLSHQKQNGGFLYIFTPSRYNYISYSHILCYTGSYSRVYGYRNPFWEEWAFIAYMWTTNMYHQPTNHLPPNPMQTKDPISNNNIKFGRSNTGESMQAAKKTHIP